MTRDVTPLPKAEKQRKNAMKPKDKATELHSMVVRARDGYTCRLCGRSDRQIQCAHIFSRRYAATRTDEENAVALCAGCHMRLTDRPHEHVTYFKHTVLGLERWEALMAKATNGEGKRHKDDFWRAEVARLKLELAALLKETDR